MRDCREHARSRLIERYVNGTPGDGMTVNEAEAELDRCRRQLIEAEDVDTALRAEEAELGERLAQERQAVRRAAGALVSRSPEFLAVAREIYTAYAVLRRNRTMIADLDRMVFLDAGITQLIDNMQPCDSGRRADYHTDEAYIAGWLDAARRLLDAADSVLPDPGGSTHSTINISDPSPVRGAPHRGSAPRRRTQGAATHLSRGPGQRKRGGKTAGMPVRRRATLVRKRDPLTGRWVGTGKSG